MLEGPSELCAGPSRRPLATRRAAGRAPFCGPLTMPLSCLARPPLAETTEARGRLGGRAHAPVSRTVGQVLMSTVAVASLDLSSRVMACVVSTHADLLTCSGGRGQ